MKNNQYKIIELFLYILIVIVGLLFLIMGKVKEPVPLKDAITSSAQTNVQHTERGKTNAFISDWKGQG